MTERKLSRREMLKLLAGGTAGVVLTSCARATTPAPTEAPAAPTEALAVPTEAPAAEPGGEAQGEGGPDRAGCDHKAQDFHLDGECPHARSRCVA